MESNQLSTKSIILWAGAAISIAVIAVVVVKLASPGDGGEGGIVSTLDPVSETDWVQGSNTLPITLIEYSDFQCPACASYYPLIERVVSDYKDSLRFVYRHFPLPYHLQAKPAAYAAEAAGKQGKFWEMYRLLFEGHDDWAEKADAEKTFASYAERIGLDMEQYRTDAASSEVKTNVDNDYRSGVRAKVNATPTFFLNGVKLQNPSSYESFKQIIDAALATSTSS